MKMTDLHKLFGEGLEEAAQLLLEEAIKQNARGEEVSNITLMSDAMDLVGIKAGVLVDYLMRNHTSQLKEIRYIDSRRPI